MSRADPEVKQAVQGLFDARRIQYWREEARCARESRRLWEERARAAEKTVATQDILISELTQEKEELQARVAYLEQELFGRKTEQSQSRPAEDDEDGESSASSSGESSGSARRRRGKQPGAKGYGRKPRSNLPMEEEFLDLPEVQKYCPNCGLPFEPFPGTADSEEIDWEVRLVRRVYRRRRYRPTCHCRAVPGIIAAPVAPKLIPKGLFSVRFWVHVVLEKFLFQRPLYRVLSVLELQGLFVSQGTLTGGLQRLEPLLEPLYQAILERSRTASRWQMDETRWMVFVEDKGNGGMKWWLWVVVTADTCSYLLEPSRSSAVVKKHLGEEARGILNADRYSVYKSLGAKILVAWCWSHIRRDFVRVRDGYQKLQAWAEAWVKQINDLFHQNRKRLDVPADTAAFVQEDQTLREQVESLRQTLDHELAAAELHLAQRKTLESLDRHWKGATLFVDYPEVPMDNNECERRLRNPVVGRKNYYGSGSKWSGRLAAMLFTVSQTLLLNELDPQKFLLAYFDACAANGGQAPENVEDFLPWNLSEEQEAEWAYPREPP